VKTILTEALLNHFTRDALRSVVTQIRREPTPPLAWQEFEQVQLHSTVKIQWSRGSKEHFRDASHFWVVFLYAQFRHANLVDADIFFHAYLQDPYTQCQDISFEEFARRVQWYNFVEGNPLSRCKESFTRRGACTMRASRWLSLLKRNRSLPRSTGNSMTKSFLPIEGNADEFQAVYEPNAPVINKAHPSPELCQNPILGNLPQELVILSV
jgi:hypothetical protein